MRLRHIEIFNAVYTVGSVSGAARFLNITQPTASKILMHAEDQIGFKLFQRISGRLVPTEEADILYRETKHITDQVASLQKVVRNLFDADRGQIRLAAISAIGLEHVSRAIVDFQRKYPDVNIEFQTRHYDNLINSIRQQEKDIGIAFQTQNEKGLKSIALGKGEFVCIYSGDELDHLPARINLADIKNHPFINIDNSGPLGDLLNKMIESSNISVETKITAQTYFVARNLVAMGGGISIVDEFTARSKGVNDVKIKAFDPPISFSIHALHREMNKPSKLTLGFLEFFKTEILDNRTPL